ncbi:MAG: YitT family protein [Clostridia bacterium]|nr:YitT family protein [Clostridia bacterium]
MKFTEYLRSRVWRRETLLAYVQILLGSLIGGAAYPLFLNANNIAPGGLTGVSMILHHFFDFLPIGTTSLVLNVPLFLLGYRSSGPIFVLRSLIATVLFSLAIDLMPLQPMTENPLLASLFGGVLLGIGLGMILRGGATTGGTDMAARMVHKRLSFISVGMFLFAFDFMVVVAAGIAFRTPEAALWAMINIYVCSKVIDAVMIGLTANKACFIISDRWESITDRILKEMDRGVTQLKARGGYSMKERPLVLAVISRSELPRVKEIVRQEDDKAFVFVTEAFEALGEGFSSLSHDQ